MAPCPCLKAEADTNRNEEVIFTHSLMLFQSVTDTGDCTDQKKIVCLADWFHRCAYKAMIIYCCSYKNLVIKMCGGGLMWAIHSTLITSHFKNFESSMCLQMNMKL